MFEQMKQIIARNPILQFSKKAAGPESHFLTDRFSSTAMSAGFGQSLSDNGMTEHERNVARQNLMFNMMKFSMQKRGV